MGLREVWSAIWKSLLRMDRLRPSAWHKRRYNEMCGLRGGRKEEDVLAQECRRGRGATTLKL